MTCYCGSNKEYKNCCEPIIKGTAKAESAEQLMRARYSAYCLNEMDFVESTHHPDGGEDFNKNEASEWSKNSVWKKLEVLDTHLGQDSDDKGEVEFKAYYEVNGVPFCHHERSKFLKSGGEWYFLDGEIHNTPLKREGPKVGRNDPCVCGSGKKFKKCCGR